MGNEGHRTADTKVGTGTLDADANRDSLTGESRAHPVGTGVGAATGSTVGAVIGGVVGGPVGAMVGAAVGGLTGGLAGGGIAEPINPTEEDAYWRQNYRTRPYVQSDRSYDEYRRAYQYGWESVARYPDRRWEDVESDLERRWDRAKGSSLLTWSEAKDAVRDAWNRVRVHFGDAEDSAWSQIYPSYPRPGTLRVPLQELHDPGTGRLDATKVAEYLKVPLKQMAEALGKNYSTVHKTPSALDLQPLLQSIKTSLVILEDVFVDRAAVLAWLNHPHPDLGQRTPLDVILQGHPNAVKNMLQAAVMGTPS